MANWDNISGKGKIDDRRGMTPASVGSLSVTGILLMMGVTYLMGGNPLDVLTQIDPSQLQQTIPTQQEDTAFEGLDSYEKFAGAVLGSNNEFWSKNIPKSSSYAEPTLVLFRQSTNSACSGASSASGPHYCSIDQTIYLDETFFKELTSSLGAKGGDVAEAYVIAHEVGHHVQNLLGTISDAYNSNEDSIKTELQADCFAGLWAGSLKDKYVFSPDEINEAIDAAAAVGDDHIQETMQGNINPESWTHGSSKARQDSFKKGFAGEDVSVCL
jgi:predicted metalloprotease